MFELCVLNQQRNILNTNTCVYKYHFSHTTHLLYRLLRHSFQCAISSFLQFIICCPTARDTSIILFPLWAFLFHSSILSRSNSSPVRNRLTGLVTGKLRILFTITMIWNVNGVLEKWHSELCNNILGFIHSILDTSAGKLMTLNLSFKQEMSLSIFYSRWTKTTIIWTNLLLASIHTYLHPIYRHPSMRRAVFDKNIQIN